MEDEYLKLTDEDGNQLNYRIISTFIYNNKNYIIYTDDTYEDGSLNVYASIFDPDDDTVLDDLTTDEEWEIVDKIIIQLEGKR